MLVWVLVLLVLIVAVGAGFLGSLAGLGGGIILTPILVLLFGIPFGDAVGASAVSILATSTTTGAAYAHLRLTDFRIGNFLQVATVPGAIIGASVTVALARTSLVPVLLILLGVVLLATIPSSLSTRPEEGPVSGPGDAISRRLKFGGSYYSTIRRTVVHYRGQNSVLALEVMFVAGLVGGLFGIGSGALKVLALDRALRLPIKVSTATSNLMIGATATAGIGVLFAGNLILPMLAAPVAIGTMAGSFFGSRLLLGIPSRMIRGLFIVVLIVLAVETIVRGAAAL
jgi:uncharacterized membrane protein YfcA